MFIIYWLLSEMWQSSGVHVHCVQNNSPQIIQDSYHKKLALFATNSCKPGHSAQNTDKPLFTLVAKPFWIYWQRLNKLKPCGSATRLFFIWYWYLPSFPVPGNVRYFCLLNSYLAVHNIINRPGAQPSECGRQPTLNIVHAQTAAARMSGKCGEWRD